ncbi:MAG TPA: guanine deaminase [Dongiaceae bacterium]|jgi:guanine deaminase
MSTGRDLPRVLRGSVLSFRDDPRRAASSGAHVYHEAGAVAVDDKGRILYAGDAVALPPAYRSCPADDHGKAIILPGFIDAHIHFPQYRMLAAPGVDLLDWLNRFTFTEEARYADAAHAAAAAEAFLDLLCAHGTTAAAAYSSVHMAAAEALFAAADRRAMALITGKTLMDRNAPDAVRDDADSGIRDSEVLIRNWHGRGRLRYAVTPRFAVTSTEAQLRAAGDLYQASPGVYMQTHLSESAGEIEMVKALFPDAQDYTDVYDRCGLLGRRSLFGHGIHLSERECARLSESGSVVVHCPTSNTFLGSGLLDIDHITDPRRPVRFAVASDVGGGLSYSMLATLAEAHKVAQLRGRRLSALDAFYLATLGNARALELDSEVGSLEPGRWADIVVLDPRATPLLASRQELSESLEDMLFALMMLGDDRAVAATYVAGRCVYRRAGEKEGH